MPLFDVTVRVHVDACDPAEACADVRRALLAGGLAPQDATVNPCWHKKPAITGRPGTVGASAR